MQPVMEPVFDTLPTGEVLLRVAKAAGGPLAGLQAASWEAYLKARWQGVAEAAGRGDFPAFWVSDARRRAACTTPRRRPRR